MIDVQDLTKTFEGRTVLNRVSFYVDKGEIFGYLGPNGAGKTTTMRIILGLLKPVSGKALVFGEDLGNNDHLRHKVGVLLERDGLYEQLSAQENLEYYADLYSVFESGEKIKELLNSVDLYQRRKDKVGNFSKGMKRKLALVRAIIHDPEVLFLDEPTSGLDPEAQIMVRDLILQLAKRGVTVFLNSHNLPEVEKICSRIAILQRGRILMADSVRELRRVHRKTFEISLEDERDAEKAQSLLNSGDYVDECERSGSRLTLYLKGEKISGVLNMLTQNNISVEEIKRISKSLENFYLEIVKQSEGES